MSTLNNKAWIFFQINKHIRHAFYLQFTILFNFSKWFNFLQWFINSSYIAIYFRCTFFQVPCWCFRYTVGAQFLKSWSTYKVTQHFGPMFRWGHVIHSKHSCTNTISIATKPDRMVTYTELCSIKSQDPLITWSCEVTWKLNMLYLHHHNDYGHQIWEADYTQWRASYHKVTRSLDHVIL